MHGWAPGARTLQTHGSRIACSIAFVRYVANGTWPGRFVPIAAHDAMIDFADPVAARHNVGAAVPDTLGDQGTDLQRCGWELEERAWA